MSYHVIIIDSHKAELSYKQGQFIYCSDANGIQKLPLEDIGAIVISCFSAKIEMKLLIEAGKLGIGLIFCEMFKPVSFLLPAIRSTDTYFTRTWENVSPKFLKELWHKTLDAKCHNQGSLAEYWEPTLPAVFKINQQKFSRTRTREANVSKLFWGIFRKHAKIPNFLRSRGKDEINSMLDYGYAILLSRVLQICFAYGIDPTFGIGHATAERSTPLAYDLMEPFRSLVDARIMMWILKNKETTEPFAINKEFKIFVLQFLNEKIQYNNTTLPAQNIIAESIRSFRKSIIEQNLDLYEPWHAITSKWAGW